VGDRPGIVKRHQRDFGKCQSAPQFQQARLGDQISGRGSAQKIDRQIAGDRLHASLAACVEDEHPDGQIGKFEQGWTRHRAARPDMRWVRLHVQASAGAVDRLNSDEAAVLDAGKVPVQDLSDGKGSRMWPVRFNHVVSIMSFQSWLASDRLIYRMANRHVTKRALYASAMAYPRAAMARHRGDGMLPRLATCWATRLRGQRRSYELNGLMADCAKRYEGPR